VTLAALASARPSTIDELLAVPGLGPVKASRFGPTLLALVAQHRVPA
jgi:DNA helicase-2/ATP-dependent DNA helicase PcrA